MDGEKERAETAPDITRERDEERPIAYFEDLSPVARSLVRAFQLGISWSPEFHAASTNNLPLDDFLRHSAAWDARGTDAEEGPATKASSKGGPATSDPLCPIGGEDLYKILSHTIAERQDETQTGIQIDGVRAKTKIDQLSDRCEIIFDRRGISASRLRVTDDNGDGIALNCRGTVQPTPIRLERCKFEGRVVFDGARFGPLSLKGATIEASAKEAPNLSAADAVFAGPLILSGMTCDGVFLNFAQIAGLLNLENATIGS